MKNKFSKSAEGALEKALIYAGEMGHTYIGSEHLLLALLSDTDSLPFKALTQSSVTFLKTRSLITENLGKGSKSSLSPSDMTPKLREIIEGSHIEALSLSSPVIKSEHLLLSLISEKESMGAKLIVRQGGDLKSIHSMLVARPSDGKALSDKDEKEKKEPPSVTLKYGRDLTRLASEKKLDPVLARESELERMICILSRRIKNNPCLIGDPGVGKTAIVEGLAMRIAERRVPESLMGKTIVRLDLPSMIAGAKYRGEFEDRMKSVLEEALKNPDLILFVDEIHTIIGAGGAEGAIDAANIIKPALARGELRMIGATTTEEYRKHVEKDSALERRFQPLEIKEPSYEDSVKIIMGLREKYEEHHGVKIPDSAIKAAVSLSKRYLTDRFLPDKAIDLIDETAAYLRLKSTLPSDELMKLEEDYNAILLEKENAVCEGRFEDAALLRDRELQAKKAILTLGESEKALRLEKSAEMSADDVAYTVFLATGIPTLLSEDEESALLSLEDELKRRIIGQNEAIRTIADAIRRSRAGLSEEGRPIASFVFLGPSGTGKTSLATELSRVLFKNEDSLIRLDMSEYSERHSISRLVGAPPGYVGYDSGGILTDKIRRHPYSVCLFDEIEKAHPDILGILLQILEDGTLTSSDGRVCDFSNSVIILTSNIGYDKLSSGTLGFAVKSTSATADGEKNLSKILRPELLGRIDDIIVFNGLSESDLLEIARNAISEIEDRASKIGITLSCSPSLAENIIKSCKKDMNARPIKRYARLFIENPLSRKILDKSIKRGDKVSAFLSDDASSVVFEKYAEK